MSGRTWRGNWPASITTWYSPLGTYTVEAWHPHMGKKTAQVKVEPGKPITVTFPAFTAADYKAPE